MDPIEISGGSKKFSLAATDWKNIGKGLLIAVGGATLTYVTQNITNIDFGPYTPVVVAGWSVVVNIARKYLTDTQA